MRSLILTVAVTTLVSATTAEAAQDVGLNLQHYRNSGLKSGIGAEIGVVVKLDNKHAVRESERVKIGFAVGPVMATSDAKAVGGVRRGISNMAGFSLRPGYSTTLALAGQSVATHYTVLGAAENEKDEAQKPEKQNRKGPSALGYIAIGVGVILVAGAIAVAVDPPLSDLFENKK